MRHRDERLGPPGPYEDRDEYERIARWVAESGGALPGIEEYVRAQGPTADDAASGRVLTQHAPPGATRDPFGDDPDKFRGGPRPAPGTPYEWPGPEMREEPEAGPVDDNVDPGRPTNTAVEGNLYREGRSDD